MQEPDLSKLQRFKEEQKAEGLRYNKGKKKWSLVDFKSFEDMVSVLEFGAEKYAKFNWMKGLIVSEVCESTLRHMFAFLEGEDVDIESKISHIGHMQCNLMFLAFMMRERPELDDRHKKEGK